MFLTILTHKIRKNYNYSGKTEMFDLGICGDLVCNKLDILVLIFLFEISRSRGNDISGR